MNTNITRENTYLESLSLWNKMGTLEKDVFNNFYDFVIHTAFRTFHEELAIIENIIDNIESVHLGNKYVIDWKDIPVLLSQLENLRNKRSDKYERMAKEQN